MYVWESENAFSSNGEETHRVLGVDFAKLDKDGAQIEELFTFGYDRDPEEMPLQPMGVLEECSNQQARERATSFSDAVLTNDPSKVEENFADNGLPTP